MPGWHGRPDGTLAGKRAPRQTSRYPCALPEMNRERVGMTQSDEEIGIAGIGLLLGGLVLLCVLGTIAFGLSTLESATPPAPVAIEEQALKGEALTSIYFEISSAGLPAESGGAIQIVKERATAAPKLNVLVSGYHDPSGNPEQNAELARQRALATKLALMATGVPAGRIFLRKPQVIPGDADLQEARRVDIHLQ